MNWHVKIADKTIGPITSDELRVYASMGQVTKETPISQGGGKWSVAGKVKGLFKDDVSPQSNISNPEPLYECPFCRGLIPGGVIKCRHCGETVDRHRRQIEELQSLKNDSTKHNGIAGLLSFFIPGLGQFIKDQPLRGVMYMIFAMPAYFLGVIGMMTIVFWPIGALVFLAGLGCHFVSIMDSLTTNRG